jgi:hypothetical protein
MKGSGIGIERVPEWIASSGSQVRCDIRDATSISFNTKEAVKRIQEAHPGGNLRLIPLNDVPNVTGPCQKGGRVLAQRRNDLDFLGELGNSR